MDPYPVMIAFVEDDEVFGSLATASIRRACACSVGAYDAEGWVAHVRSTQPDILLLDLWLGGRDMTPLLPPLAACCPTTMIAVLTSPPGVRDEARALEAGAFVCYEKRSVHAKHLGEYLISDLELFRRMLSGDDVTAPSCHDRFVEATAGA